MKCPFCNEEIERNLDTCSICGEKIPRIYSIIDFGKEFLLKFVKSKQFIISIIVAVVLFFGAGITITIIDSVQKTSNVDIYMTSSSKYDVTSSIGIDRSIREILLTDELTRQAVQSSHSPFFAGEKGKNIRRSAFEKLLSDLDKLTRDFNAEFNRNENEVYKRYEKLKEGNTIYYGSLRLIPVFRDKKIGNDTIKIVDKIEINEPSIPIIHLIYAGEGYFEPEIDYNYLYAVYGKDLDKDYREYITLKIKEQNDLKNCAYVMDGALGINKIELKDWLIAWYKFSKKYPEFRKDEISRMITIYTKDLIWSSYNTFEIADDEKLLPEAKQAYENLLKEIDKDSKPYEYVKKYYDILKKHDFKFHNEFRDEYEKDFNGYGFYT